jgi:hypothetical protein
MQGLPYRNIQTDVVQQLFQTKSKTSVNKKSLAEQGSNYRFNKY